MDNEIHPTSQGLLRCLQALAEEAACLGLARTYLALQDSVRACMEETGPALGTTPTKAPAAVLH